MISTPMRRSCFSSRSRRLQAPLSFPGQRRDLPGDDADRHAGRASPGAQPLAYLVATATASNCGSVATITGNPQNMVIGAISSISYPAFTVGAGAGRGFGVVAVVASYASRTARNSPRDGEFQPHPRPDPSTSVRSSRRPWCAGLAVAFFAGVPPAEAALLGGAILLFTRADQALSDLSRDRRAAVVHVRGPVRRRRRSRAGAIDAGHHRYGQEPRPRHAWRLSLFTAVLSNIVSNVPAVLVLRPFIRLSLIPGGPGSSWR